MGTLHIHYFVTFLNLNIFYRVLIVNICMCFIFQSQTVSHRDHVTTLFILNVCEYGLENVVASLYLSLSVHDQKKLLSAKLQKPFIAIY